MMPPTDLEILREIYSRHYSEFATFSKENPSRETKIYVPIDIPAVASSLGVDPDIVFGRLYYHLEKKHAYKQGDGSSVHLFALKVGDDRHCVNFPLLAAVLATLGQEGGATQTGPTRKRFSRIGAAEARHKPLSPPRTVKLTKASVAWDDLLPSVLKAIQEWEPGAQGSERGYRDSLVEHLRQCAPDARLETEYRDHGTTVDIYVKWLGIIASGELYIEAKKDLKSKSEFDRLLGQIETLDPRQRQIILVLCGDTKQDFVDRLRERYSTHLYPSSLIIMDPGRIAIVVKAGKPPFVDRK